MIVSRYSDISQKKGKRYKFRNRLLHVVFRFLSNETNQLPSFSFKIVGALDCYVPGQKLGERIRTAERGDFTNRLFTYEMRVFKVAAKVPKIPKVPKTKCKQPVTFVDFVSVSEKVHSIKQSIFTYSHLFRSLYILNMIKYYHGLLSFCF